MGAPSPIESPPTQLPPPRPSTESPPSEYPPPSSPTTESPPTESPPTNSIPPPSPTESPPPPTPTESPPNQSKPPQPTPSSPPHTPSLTTPPSPPPPTWYPSPPSKPNKVKCKNKNNPKCYTSEHACPASCPGQCEVNCVSCKPLCNPRFIGADGFTFYFHGKKDKDFCLVSDNNLHINGHFIGKRNKNMGRDFTWVQSIGVLFDNHKLQISAQKTSSWDDAIDRISLTYDGKSIILPETEGAKWEYSRTSITRTQDTNDVVVEVKNLFKITVGSIY
ncbi:hypothetical protein Tco_1087013 [Tanacetum coccineum]